jgi:membrane protease YdiL (CAAX protease family)
LLVVSLLAMYAFVNKEITAMIINRVLYAPFVEEGVYRVIVMGAFLRAMNKHVAVIISALLFAALHCAVYDPGVFNPIHLAAGIIMGYVFIWGKNLGLNTAIHALGNIGLMALAML